MFYWYSIFYFFISIIIGQLISDQNVKVIFYAVMFLLYISCYNIYITFNYYIKLRNNPGIKGDRGDPGDPGQRGSNGVCSMAKSCGITNCRKMIVETLKDKISEYKVILKKQKENIELSKKEKKILKQINVYIDILIPKCETFNDTNNPISNFKKIIDKTISK